MKVLVTGYSGFIGSHFVSSAEGIHELSFLGRKDNGKECFLADIDGHSDYRSALIGIDVVVHLAARAHVMSESEVDPLGAYMEVNSKGTANLARQAAECGVKRFIFLSSIKVNGEQTNLTPFHFNDLPNPSDPYGQSKLSAEITLRKISKSTGLQIVIIRPPLVYGRGVKANFEALASLVKKGLPLPFASIRHNRRSMVYVGNLISLIHCCLESPAASNETFLVSDCNDISTAEFVKLLQHAYQSHTIQIYLPIWLFKLVGKLTGKSDLISRLTGSLQIDCSHTLEKLNWQPPVSISEAFKHTVQTERYNGDSQ